MYCEFLIRLLYPAILIFCVLGVYAVNGSAVDIGIMTTMGALGYMLRKFDFETAPVVLGLILAPMLEMSFRQSLAMSSGQLHDLCQSADRVGDVDYQDSYCCC